MSSGYRERSTVVPARPPARRADVKGVVFEVVVDILGGIVVAEDWRRDGSE